MKLLYNALTTFGKFMILMGRTFSVYNLRLLIDGIRFMYIKETICTFNDADGMSSNVKDRDFLKVRRQMVCRAVGVLPYYWGILQRAKRRLMNEKY